MTITRCEGVHDGGKKLVHVALREVRVDDLDDRIDHQFGWEASEDSSVLGFFIGDAEEDELGLAEAHPSCW